MTPMPKKAALAIVDVRELLQSIRFELYMDGMHISAQSNSEYIFLFFIKEPLSKGYLIKGAVGGARSGLWRVGLPRKSN